MISVTVESKVNIHAVFIHIVYLAVMAHLSSSTSCSKFKVISTSTKYKVIGVKRLLVVGATSSEGFPVHCEFS